MTFQSATSEFVTTEDASFVSARIAMLDAFTKLELTIATILITFHPEVDLAVPFGGKLAALAKVDNPKLSKKAMERFKALRAELAPLMHLRNVIVHGSPSRADHEGQAKLAFQNVADAAIGLPQFTLLSVANLQDARKACLNIANQLKNLATPPSPPRPSPVAASDP